MVKNMLSADGGHWQDILTGRQDSWVTWVFLLDLFFIMSPLLTPFLHFLHHTHHPSLHCLTATCFILTSCYITQPCYDTFVFLRVIQLYYSSVIHTAMLPAFCFMIFFITPQCFAIPFSHYMHHSSTFYNSLQH